MAYIKQEKDGGYYLAEGHRENGKVKFSKIYLGMKPPFPKSQGWTGLDPGTIAKLKAKAIKRKGNAFELKMILAETANLPDQNIINGDLSILYDKVEDNSASLFFTDPPYGEGTLNLYANLAELANRKLKSGGLCLTYIPHPHLVKVIDLMREYLDYWWIFSVSQTGLEPRIWKNNLWVGWKPIIAFIKNAEVGRLTTSWFRDNFRGLGEDKRYHKWGQDIHEATYWIEALTPIGGLVVDPFAGGGTIPLACKITGRRWVATEIDSTAVAIARKRLVDYGSEKNKA